MLDRAVAEAVFAEAVAACDPAARVEGALRAPEVVARLAGRRRFGIAIGKAALARILFSTRKVTKGLRCCLALSSATCSPIAQGGAPKQRLKG